MTLRLLRAFRALFDGHAYLHRNSSLGDRISVELFEDLVELGRVPKLSAAVAERLAGVGPTNRTVTLKRMRRGDGTFGQLVEPAKAKSFPGYAVARGAIATIELATEVKILSKAMIKQIDRVINDLEKQVRGWQEHAPHLVSVAVVGINQAPVTTSYEGERNYRTDGAKHKHPADEAGEAEQRIKQRVVATRMYDEVLILRYSATNEPPFPFAWVDEAATIREYRAALIRLSAKIEQRF